MRGLVLWSLSNKSNNCAESHLKALEIARTNKSGGSRPEARLPQKCITLQSRYLVRFCIEQLWNSRCWRFDISTSVEIMLFVFIHVCFLLRALDVEVADVRQDMTQ
jgi:hypothetical protein